MLNYKLTNEALDFLKNIPKKHAKQITGKIEKLANNPSDVQGEQLAGYPKLKRFKSGEYRVIYRIVQGVITVLVLRIGKRNDGDVYRGLDTIDPEGD